MQSMPNAAEHGKRRLEWWWYLHLFKREDGSPLLIELPCTLSFERALVCPLFYACNFVLGGMTKSCWGIHIMCVNQICIRSTEFKSLNFYLMRFSLAWKILKSLVLSTAVTKCRCCKRLRSHFWDLVCVYLFTSVSGIDYGFANS